jgi:hypothetical protein
VWIVKGIDCINPQGDPASEVLSSLNTSVRKGGRKELRLKMVVLKKSLVKSKQKERLCYTPKRPGKNSK